MSDLTFDVLFRSQADTASIERLRASVRSFHTDVTNVNQMLVQNRGNMALGSFGDRLDITKIRSGTAAVKDVAKAAGGASFDFKDLAGSVLGFTSAVGLITTVVLSGVNAIATLVRGTEQMAEAADAARNRLEISAESAQTFSAILRDAGQDANAAAPALDRLGQVIGDALVDPSGAAATSLEKVRLTAQSLKGLPRELQLELVAKGLNEIADADERAAAAKDLLGRGASQLRPLLLALANEGLVSLIAKAKETGAVLSDEMVTALDEVGDRTENNVRRMQVSIAPALLLWKEMKASVTDALASMIDFESKFRATDLLSPGKVGAKVNRAIFGGGEKAPDPNAAMDAQIESARKEAEAEALAYIEIEDAKRKKKDAADTALDIANAAARKASLEKQIADGNALFLKAEEEKRAQTKDTKDAELELEADLALARKKALEDEILKGNALYLQWLEKEKLLKQTAAQEQLADSLNDQEARRAAIESDWTRTVNEKRPAIVASLQRENQLIAERIALLEKERDTADPIRKGQIRSEIDSLSGRLRSNNSVLAEPSANSLRDQFTSATVGFQDQIGSVPQQLGRAWGDMADGMRSSFNGAVRDMLKYGGDLKDGINSFTLAMGEAFLNTTATMISDWFMSHVIMENVRRVFNLKRTTEEGAVQATLTGAHVAGEATRLGATATTAGAQTGIITAAASTQAAATGTAGVFRSIMELGPIAGPVVMGASIAGMLALVMAAVGAIGNHADGTIIRGPGTGTSDSIFARLSNGEAIIPSNRVRQYGPAFIQGIIDGRALPGGIVSQGAPAAAAPGATARPKVTVIMVNNMAEAAQAAMRAPEGEKIIVRATRSNRSHLGFDS